MRVPGGVEPAVLDSRRKWTSMTGQRALDTRFVDPDAMRRLTKGLSINVVRCAEVLDHALESLNEQNHFPDSMLKWIEAGALVSGPCPDDGKGRIIVDLTQTKNAKDEYGYFAVVLRKSDEHAGPVVFISMHSPILDIPMRVEIPLRALLKGNDPLEGTYCLYLHALFTDKGNVHTYYGITKRGWNLRFSEHMKAALAQKSKRLLAKTLNELIEARTDELYGTPDNRPKLIGLVSTLCGVGLGRKGALDGEERLVEKYSLASKHLYGLNMIPGGEAGLRVARHFFRKA